MRGAARKHGVCTNEARIYQRRSCPIWQVQADTDMQVGSDGSTWPLAIMHFTSRQPILTLLKVLVSLQCLEGCIVPSENCCGVSENFPLPPRQLCLPLQAWYQAWTCQISANAFDRMQQAHQFRGPPGYCQNEGQWAQQERPHATGQQTHSPPGGPPVLPAPAHTAASG